MKKESLRYVLLGTVLGCALIAQASFSALAVAEQIQSRSQPRFPFRLTPFGTTIQFVAPSYHESGILPGDDVIAIDGVPLTGQMQLEKARETLQAGQKLLVTVERNEAGKEVRHTAQLEIVAPHSIPAGWTLVVGVSVVLPLLSLLIGSYILFARPQDPLAWITMIMLASFGQLASHGAPWSIVAPIRQLLFVYRAVLDNTWPLWMLLFGLYFPTPFEFLRKRRWVIALLALFPACLAVVDLYGYFAAGEDLRALNWLANLNEAVTLPATVLFFAYVIGFFVSLVIKSRGLTSYDAKRRLRVMIFGCSLALLPFIPVVLSQLNLIPRLPMWALVFGILMLMFFPLTIAYVIVVQRAMDVRMVVRSGVQYALANTGVRVVQIVLVGVVSWLMFYFAQQSEHRLEGIAVVAAGVLLIALLSRSARAARQWMDRRFFREAYNSELILTDLTSSVAGIRDTRRLLETVAHRIADSLHVPRIAVLLESGGHFQPAYSLGFEGAGPDVQFTEQTATVRTLKRLGSPSKIYFDDPQSWVHGTSLGEQTALHTLDSQVLLPVSLNTRLLGIISLGSKRSEEPYTKADLQLLSAVAAQTGLAIENAHLTESIRREIAQRERLDRELEIARDVQQRLFPQKLPIVAGLDFAGYCRPASGVGGDYYDFIHLANGSLGIAVGDVSGKGIAAALMMASLQASLRGQTIRPSGTISEMIDHINRLVYEASEPNRYATFFYAQYDPITRTLRYVNAGHNPPLVRRPKKDGFEFIRLDEGGTVIGLFPEFPFREAEVCLNPGDVVIAFTDGISEALNAVDEEFDEERLIEALEKCPQRLASEIVTYILDRVDAFTAGAKQSDDMTIVVVRVQ